MKYRFLLFFLIVTSSVWSDITLYECLESALKNNEQIIANSFYVKNAQTNLNIALGKFLPKVELYNNLSRKDDGANYNENGVTLSTSYSLFDQRWYNYKKTQCNEKIAEINFAEIKQNILKDVIIEYCNYLYYSKELALKRAIVSDYQNEYQVKSKLQASGSCDELTLLSLKLELNDCQISLNEIVNNIKYTRKNIKNLTSLEINDGARLENIDTCLTIEIDSLNNYASNLNWKNLQYEIKSFEYSKKSAFFNRFPSLSIGFNLQYKHQYDLAEKTEVDYDYWNNSWLLYIGLSYTLDNLINNNYEYKNYDRTLRSYHYQQKYYQNSLILQINNLQDKLKIITDNLMIYQEKMSLAQQQKQLAKIKYEKGLESFLDYNQIIKNYLNANLAYEKLKQDYLLNIVEWQILNNHKILARY